MDPHAMLNELRECIRAGGDFAAAVMKLNEYYQWRLKGGFAPPGGDRIADVLAHQLADILEGVQ